MVYKNTHFKYRSGPEMKNHWLFLWERILFAFSNIAAAATWTPPAGTDCRWCKVDNWWFSIIPTLSQPTVINSTTCPVVIDYGCSAARSILVAAQFAGTAEMLIEPQKFLE